SGRRIDRGLIFAVELLHGEQALRSARGERLEHDALQAMVLGIVVRLAEEHVPGARGVVEKFLRRDEALGMHVPDPADQRMFAGRERSSAAGEGEGCESEEKVQAKMVVGDER